MTVREYIYCLNGIPEGTKVSPDLLVLRPLLDIFPFPGERDSYVKGGSINYYIYDDELLIRRDFYDKFGGVQPFFQQTDWDLEITSCLMEGFTVERVISYTIRQLRFLQEGRFNYLSDKPLNGVDLSPRIAFFENYLAHEINGEKGLGSGI